MKTTDEIMGLVEAYVLARCRFHDMSQSFTRQMGADVKSTGDALRAALTASMDWQGIETAPKDKSLLLFWECGEPAVGYRCPDTPDDAAIIDQTASYPSHWKPLPPPPAEGSPA